MQSLIGAIHLLLGEVFAGAGTDGYGHGVVFFCLFEGGSSGL